MRFPSYLLFLGTLIVLTSVGFASSLRAQDPANIVTNPGFETGNFTGWTLGGATDNLVVGMNAHSGTYAASFGNEAPGLLFQDLQTTAGTSYDLSFYVMDEAGGEGTEGLQSSGITQPVQFQAYFDGTLVFDSAVSGDPDNGYVEISVPGLTTSTTLTTLEFDFENDPSYFDLDDVSVTASVPEPSTWALLGSGALGVAGLKARRRFHGV